MFFSKKENNHFVFNLCGIKLKFKMKKKYNNSILYNESKKLPSNIKITFAHSKIENSEIKILKSDELEKHRGNIHICVLGNNCKVFIDKGLQIRGRLRIEVTEGRSVYIGKDCLIADDVRIMTSDYHRIFDMHTNEILNLEKDVYIGNHCWLANYVRILKGARIPNNSVVGMSSLVNKEFYKENVIIAGIPAKIVKENVTWLDY